MSNWMDRPLPEIAAALRDGTLNARDLTEEAIFENGSIYVLKTSLLRETGCRLGGKISVHLQSPEHTHEIDDLEDLQWVRVLAKVSSESYCSD